MINKQLLSQLVNNMISKLDKRYLKLLANDNAYQLTSNCRWNGFVDFVEQLDLNQVQQYALLDLCAIINLRPYKKLIDNGVNFSVSNRNPVDSLLDKSCQNYHDLDQIIKNKIGYNLRRAVINLIDRKLSSKSFDL